MSEREYLEHIRRTAREYREAVPLEADISNDESARRHTAWEACKQALSPIVVQHMAEARLARINADESEDAE